MLDTDYGCEMRNRFWLGIIVSRDPDEEPDLVAEDVQEGKQKVAAAS